MKTVLVDTNIILWTFSGGPDFRNAITEIAPSYDVAVPSCVISELKKLGTKQAKAALKYCKTQEIIDIGKGYADKMLVLASENGYVIATNDKDLLKELGKRGLNELRRRGKTQLIPTESELI